MTNAQVCKPPALMAATSDLMKRFDEMVTENKEEKLDKRKKMQ